MKIKLTEFPDASMWVREKGIKGDTRFLARGAERIEQPLTAQERLRDSGLEEDKELALTMFSGR